MERYRFTVTTYNRNQLVRCKDILTAKLSPKYTEFTFTFNQHTHKGTSLSFWVDVTFSAALDSQYALFQILKMFRAAIENEPMTVSLDTKLPNEIFRCADVDISVKEVAFGLVHSPFQFQSVCVVDPMQQKIVHIDKFMEHYQQVYRISFFHDRRFCELQMPMIDDMDRQRFEMRRKRKMGGSIALHEARQIEAYLKAQNDPAGCRNEKNEVLLRLPYENIKLLIFDIEDVTMPTIKGDLIIVYEHPPMVHMYPLNKNGERAVNYAPRYVRWSKNFSIKDFMEPMVQSSAVKLKVAFNKDVFYSLLAMNKLRLSCDMSFRKFGIPKNAIDLSIRDSRGYQDEWKFEIRYLIECILSRGSIGKRAILGTAGNYNRVFGMIRKHLMENDGMKKATDYLMDIFFRVLKADIDTEYEEEVVRRRFQSNIDDPSYIAIRKAIVTPTRILYYPPEPAMGFRLIRHFKADRFLRVVFRDDTMDTLHNLSEELIDETITRLMKDGIKVGGQKFFYLGYSNSQLRDQGCYFYRGDKVDDLMEVYDRMGEFKKENVAKTMARFAQCFTQSYASKIDLPRSRVAEIPDFSNSSVDAKGNPYCFSDGVGMMSLTTAKMLQLELGFKTTPSCYQFRYAGYKGVVSVDPFLSKYAEFIESKGLTPHETTPYTKEILFRPSQNKFTATEEHASFEMVKRSAPCAVNLNKQLINIYDQVAMKQSQRVYSNVTKRILQLTDIRINSIMTSLTDENSFQLVLRELPAFVPYRQLKGFTSLVVEPFFRRLVMAWAKSTLKYLSEKARIPVPSNYGRNMFGIVDETGYLQYGQVFVQYSESLYEHSDNTNAIILKGSVMITKNPMMNGGDLRKFDAIDIPALRHLRDVVVFSQHGPRPAPDEMAGSDLDGDEYSVIWDPDLMLEYSAPAMDYSPESPKPKKKTFEELLNDAELFAEVYKIISPKTSHMMTVRAKSIEFFKDYLINDSIGVVANAHLGNSDLYGIDSRVCERIARKQIAAVDFAKSGVPMEPLTKFWENKQPPERVERFPDFMQKDHRPFYQSNRLMGHVHRKIQQFVDSVGAFIDSDADVAKLDEYVDLNGWQEFEKEAEVIYDNYTEELQRLLMTFGIKNEAELFSQCFTDIKFRQLRNQESDNLSGFSTASLIQKHLYGILSRYRKEFFAEMRGGFDKDPQDPRTFLLTRFAHVVPSKLRRKAVAYYKVAYRNGNFLSFPWVVWDVIDTIRMEKRPLVKFDPRGEHLSAEIERVSADDFHIFLMRIYENFPPVLPYIDRYDGLGFMLYCLCQWKKRRESLARMSEAEIVFIFMLYASGEMYTSPAFVRHPDELPGFDIIDLRTRPGGLGRLLLGFFITISRDDFFDHPQNWLVTHTFGFDVDEDFCDVEKWRLLHAAARDTYFKSVFQSSPSLLASDTSNSESTVILGEYFTIEVIRSFEHCINDTLMRNLCHLTGCSHIAWRIPDVITANNRQRDDYRIRVIMWPKGPLNAIQKLRRLLTINAPISRNEKPADVAFLMKHHTTVRMTKLLQAH